MTTNLPILNLYSSPSTIVSYFSSSRSPRPLSETRFIILRIVAAISNFSIIGSAGQLDFRPSSPSHGPRSRHLTTFNCYKLQRIATLRLLPSYILVGCPCCAFAALCSLKRPGRWLTVLRHRRIDKVHFHHHNPTLLERGLVTTLVFLAPSDLTVPASGITKLYLSCFHGCGPPPPRHSYSWPKLPPRLGSKKRNTNRTPWI